MERKDVWTVDDEVHEIAIGQYVKEKLRISICKSKSWAAWSGISNRRC